MPIGPSHAFSGQRPYRRPTARWLLASLYEVARGVRNLEGAWRALWAWAAFERNSVLSPGVRLGPGAWCVNYGRRADITIGEDTVCRGILRREPFGTGRILIHQGVYIGDDCLLSCAAGIEVLPHTLLAHGVQVFDNDSHPLSAVDRRADYASVLKGHGARQGIGADPVVIGPDAWIGFGAIVLKGLVVGEGSIVAAGSVVTSSVPPNTLVAGNPAKVVRKLAED